MTASKDPPTISTVGLLELPYAFSQLPALTTAAFSDEAAKHGLRLTAAELEGLRRLRLLTPFFRYRRDGRAVAAALRGRTHMGRATASFEPTSTLDLEVAYAAGRLFDPVDDGFTADRRQMRSAGGVKYKSNVHLYSPHQMTVLPLFRSVRSAFVWSEDHPSQVVGLDVPRQRLEALVERAGRLRQIAVATTLLEAVYYPRLTNNLRLSLHELDVYERWVERLPVNWALRHLGVNAGWVRESSLHLLGIADSIDPLKSWLPLVREVSPSKWKLLQGEARTAIILRVAAEMLLRYYEDLAAARRAPNLKKYETGRLRSPFAGRLKRTYAVDEALTDFGLSPHPSLVLVVEGDTEQLLFPRVMEHFQVNRSEQLISIQNARGVGTDLGPLMAYAVTPRAEPESDGQHVRLLRPPTRVLVIVDAERPMGTAEAREKRRTAWIERIFLSLPVEQRTDAVKSVLGDLVHVRTWNDHGDSFEFAHFTDHQIAKALAQVDDRSARQPDAAKRVEIVRQRRRVHGKLDDLVYGSR